jgi:hypothetical protein
VLFDFGEVVEVVLHDRQDYREMEVLRFENWR